METLQLDLPYSEVTLLLDSMRHYIEYIKNLDEDSVDEDGYANLMNDLENLKNLERSLSCKFKEKFGEY